VTAGDTPGSLGGTRSQVPWFSAWAVVGVGAALGVSVLGIFTIPLALLLATFLLVRHHADRSALGLLVGMGLLFLYVAYVQRRGPGTVSWHTATASGEDSYMDPRPWLIAGLLLIVVGFAAFLWRGHKVTTSRESPQR
jgi:hypothetical protein